ncbi:MAG: hypothetical protein J6U79_04680 [Paludibacteraceae bacterium]|nr:hypothetical protein [Paludibacteraceae bacterium]
MKKIFSVIFITLLIFTFTSCEKEKTAKSVVGHTFGIIESSTSYFTIYFSKSGYATIKSVEEEQSMMTSHFTYEITDNDVEVYYDYSNYWIETARGELALHFTYDPIDDVLVYMGERLSRMD